jgi:Icc protein
VDVLAIAHLSDLRIDRGQRGIERPRRVVDYLAGLRTPVDVILVTGDIADHGAAAEYARAPSRRFPYAVLSVLRDRVARFVFDHDSAR